MLFIHHNDEPPLLQIFREAHPVCGRETWQEFLDSDKNVAHRELLQALHRLQGGLCAYCERAIDLKRAATRHVDHIVPRNEHTGDLQLTLTYANMVLSCTQEAKGRRTCGMAKDARRIPVSPTEDNAGLFILDTLTGNLEPAAGTGRERDARETIAILNLNAPFLASERKAAIVRLKRFIALMKESPLNADERRNRLNAYIGYVCENGSFTPMLKNMFFHP